MHTALYKVTLPVLLFILLSASGAYAQDKKSCDAREMKQIEKFDKKIERHIAETNELKDMLNEKSSHLLGSRHVHNSKANELKEIHEKIKKRNKFWDSDEYKAMEKLYKKCGVEVPEDPQKKPFWVPDK